MKKATKLALSITALVGVGAVTLTYAYWSQTASIDNPFNTSSYGSSLVETFNPTDGEDWQPGSEVDKIVMVENTGETSLIVRAKLDETWSRADSTGTLVAYKEIDAADDANEDNENSDLAIYGTYQENATDGYYTNDDTIVTKNFSSSELWVDGGDGWYYYSINLPAGTSTDNWLESVTLLSNADMGYYADTCQLAGEKVNDVITWYAYDVAEGETFTAPAYFTVDADGKAVAAEADENGDYVEGAIFTAYSKAARDLDDTIPGYSGSDYVLTVTIQTVQPTQEAIDTVFGTVPTGIGADWVLADAEDELV
ncbi:BsaA family SipW-dependent biofilm matrix protein [Bengtsoniella intestinalis]|uniref:BsaA family SipW-dependent biofilm matrix protein n=1 Tax=Bengtsoniella intestinalis TaxID=3073143 RepID=UPI00391FA75C